MPTRTSVQVRTVVLLTLSIALASAGELNDPITQTIDGGAFGPTRSSEIVSTAAEWITVQGASPSQTDRLHLAVRRFADAGLLLPELDVTFSTHVSDCGGHRGLFRVDSDPWRISICTPVDSVYEHELAHAWDKAMLSDELRRDFMELRGHTVWSSKRIPWNQRGQEDLAVVIQQGLGSLPLPPALGRETRSRLEGFELLTGRPAPVLTEWIEARDIPCHQRPTAMSGLIPDSTQRVCRGTWRSWSRAVSTPMDSR